MALLKYLEKEMQ